MHGLQGRVRWSVPLMYFGGNGAGPDASKIWVTAFDIDFSRCIFCGLCVEACLPQSLVHTKQYEGAVYHLSGMVSHFRPGWSHPRATRQVGGSAQIIRRQRGGAPVIVCWVFAAITLAAVAVAAFVGDIRRAALSLWVGGAERGGHLLDLGRRGAGDRPMDRCRRWLRSLSCFFRRCSANTARAKGLGWINA